MPLFTSTPVIASRILNGRPPVRFKMDCYQPTGSFKIRGMDHLVRQAMQVENQTRFVASSGGNAGFSLAYAGKQNGVQVTVVVPETTKERARQMIRDQGAQVKVHGANWNAADSLAREIAQDLNAMYVSPFDHPWLWEGHSSIVNEIASHCGYCGENFPDTIVLSVGGGGLLLGVMEGLERYGKLEDTKIIAAETEGAASLKLALEKGHTASLPEIRSVATSLGARQVADQAFHRARTANVVPYTMSDADALSACRTFLNEFNVVVEPACGAALSYVYREDFAEENVLVVVCGGMAWSYEDQVAAT